MSLKYLSKEDLAVISEVFTQAYVLDLPEKWDAEYEEDPEMNENSKDRRERQTELRLSRCQILT